MSRCLYWALGLGGGSETRASERARDRSRTAPPPASSKAPGAFFYANFNLDFNKMGKNKLFYDVIYNPSETNFLKSAKEYGNVAENGKLMFIYQAASAFNLWHRIQPKVDYETIRLLDI